MSGIRPAWRLAPAAVAAWIAGALAIGAPELAPVAALTAWLGVAALVVALVTVRRRRRGVLALVVLATAAAALVLSAVAAEAPRRAPPALVDAAGSGQAVELDVTITGRVVEGRVRGTVTAVVDGDAREPVAAPVLVFSEPGERAEPRPVASRDAGATPATPPVTPPAPAIGWVFDMSASFNRV